MTDRQINIVKRAYETAHSIGCKRAGLTTSRGVYRYAHWSRLLEGSSVWAALHPRERQDWIGEEVREAWASGIIDGLYERKAFAAEGGHADPSYLLGR